MSDTHAGNIGDFRSNIKQNTFQKCADNFCVKADLFWKICIIVFEESTTVAEKNIDGDLMLYLSRSDRQRDN